MNPLAVHIIVHNDFSHVHQAIDSLYAQTAAPFDLHITINAGEQSDIDVLQAAFPQAAITVNEKPQGFAANHNALMRHVENLYIALLNDDITLQSGTLDTLVNHLEAHPTVGMVGANILNPDGSPQQSVFSDPSLFRMIYRMSGLSNLTGHSSPIRNTLVKTGIARLIGVESMQAQTETREVPIVVGVCMVVRKTATLEAGLMDEDTAVYGEEFGWQLRLRQHGWPIIYVTEAVLIHFNPTTDVTGWKLTEHRKSLLCYTLRYRPRWQGVLIRAAMIVLHLPRIPYYWFTNRPMAAINRQIVQLALCHTIIKDSP